MIVVAGLGILINGFTAWLFASGGERDVNIRGAYLHMASDALVSAGVVIAGVVIWLTGLAWIDPLVSLLIVVCAIQVPRLLHHSSAGADAAPAVAAPDGESAATAGAALAAQAVASVPAPHLRALRGFAWKDPFRQQMTAKPAAGAPAKQPSKTAAPPTQSTATLRTPPAVSEAVPPAQTESFTPTPVTGKPVVVGKPGVLLLVDGRKLGLLPGDLFPTADPVFRLVSFTKKTAKVALVTGTLDGGSTTLQLQAGHRLVLTDASTGERYVLLLVRPAQVVPSTAKPPKS